MPPLAVPFYSVFVVGAFVAKMLAVSLWSTSFDRETADRRASLLAAWLLTMAVQISAILIFSAFHGLSTATIWAFLALWLSAGAVAFARNPKPKLSIGWGFILPAAVILVAGWRALVFSDSQWDAMTYELPRVAIWMNYQTVFVHMPTVQANIFSSEWNGELNSLLYGLAVGNVHQLAFANIEVLIFLAIASHWLADQWGARHKSLIAAAVVSTPAVLGIASTMKGDLMAVAGIVIAFGWIVRAGRDGSRFALVMAVLSLAFAAGSKIGVIPGVGVCSIYLALHYRKRLREFFAPRLAVPLVAGSAIFIARYIANVFVYHRPFFRVAGEKTSIAFVYLEGNLRIAAARWMEWWPVDSAALCGGLGLVGVCSLVGLGVRAGRPPRSAWVAILSLLMAALAALFIPPEPWTFRYLLPFVLPFVIWTISAPVDHRPISAAFAAALSLAVGMGIYHYFDQGDMSPEPTFAQSVESSLNRTPLMHALYRYETHAPAAGVTELNIDTGPGKTIAICNAIDNAISPFVGSYAQNRLILTDSLAGLAAVVAQRHPDIVVIVKPTRYKGTDPVSLITEAQRLSVASVGYRWIIDNDAYVIARRIQ